MFSMLKSIRHAFIGKVIVITLALSTITLIMIPSTLAVTIEKKIIEYPRIMDRGDGDGIGGIKIYEYQGFGNGTSNNPSEAFNCSENTDNTKEEIRQLRMQIINWLLFFNIIKH